MPKSTGARRGLSRKDITAKSPFYAFRADRGSIISKGSDGMVRKTGEADLPLHTGPVPRWLFRRMKRLAREIIRALVEEYDRDEVLRRLSDPFWFQALGCALGFDWHSSGLTTTTCAALKEGLSAISHELGIFFAGGKGRTSLRTPDEIREVCDKIGIDAEPLIYASRMAAKVDNVAVQDGYQIYHHTFVFTADGKWAVIQQGMNEATGMARRYHWASESLRSFVEEPHTAICAGRREERVLNMVSSESRGAREASVEIVKEKPERILLEWKKVLTLEMPRRHWLKPVDFDLGRLYKALRLAHEADPRNYEQLLGVRGVGPATVRALALLSELLFGKPPSWRDPARFAFAHGGKDGHPFPVDRRTYETSIAVLQRAVEAAKVGDREKIEALRRLSRLLR